MTALVQAVSRIAGTETESDALTIIGLFCSTGLLVSLALVTFGIDLCPSF